jgi:hypothetical protein
MNDVAPNYIITRPAPSFRDMNIPPYRVTDFKSTANEDLLSMVIKRQIGRFYKELKFNIPEILKVYYQKKEDLIRIHLIIDEKDVYIKKRIYDEITKLYNVYDNYYFDFLIISKEFEEEYKDTKMDILL